MLRFWIRVQSSSQTIYEAFVVIVFNIDGGLSTLYTGRQGYISFCRQRCMRTNGYVMSLNLTDSPSRTTSRIPVNFAKQLMIVCRKHAFDFTFIDNCPCL